MNVRLQPIVSAVLLTFLGSFALTAESTGQEWPSPGQPGVQPAALSCDPATMTPEQRRAAAATYWANTAAGRLVRMVHRDTKRNRCWPKPFVCPDRAAVRSPFVAMVAKGWMRQNTLGEHHFEPETGKLTYSGILRVRKILLEGPVQHRTIYVHRALNPTETSARVDAVQQLAAKTVVTGELPAVLETNLPAPGWPAEQVDAVGRRYRSTIPDPRLPEASATGEDSSGS